MNGGADKRRNVFIVANNVEEIGGVQRVVHAVAAGLAARGHRVELIGVGPGAGSRKLRPGAGYVTVTLGRGEPAPWEPRSFPDYIHPSEVAREVLRRVLHRRHVKRLQQLFAEVDSGIVIVAQVWAMRWVADADTRHLKVVGMSHESFEASHVLQPGTTGPSRYERVRRLYRDLDAVLLLTDADADKWRQEGLPNVQVMPNPLPLWPDRVSQLTAPVVVAIGRLEPEKRYDLLVAAWRLLRDRHPQWQLRIYGEGSLHADLEQEIARAHLQDGVQLMGPTDDVAAALMGASALALSSDREGLPLVLLEAMACGVPCVAVDCAPGIRQIIDDGVDGIVVPPGDAGALADGLERVISNPELRTALGSAARRSVASLQVDAVAQRWERLFDELLG
ncbi:MAG TPA: glycosyltransferase [Mycobacteriales bacterium]|nr:glycosyltransferase [Mycobacteriales bacterium]